LRNRKEIDVELRLRPYATAGIALVGASVIAISPVAPPLPDVKIANPSVNLSAAIDPFTPWIDVLENAGGNLEGLVDSWAEAPFPVLQQVIANQLSYLSELPDFELIVDQFLTNLQAGLEAPFAPDLVGSVDPAHAALFGLLPVLGVLPPELQPLIDFSASPLSGVLLGLVGPVVAPVLALAASVGAIVNNLTGEEPDLEAAFNTLVNIPASMADAFLNGGQTLDLTPVLTALGVDLELIPGLPPADIGLTFGGLLSPGGSIFNALDISAGPIFVTGQGPGAIGSLINLSKAIARAIGWDGTGNPLEADDTPPPPALPRSADDTSLLKASSTTVTLPTTTDSDIEAGADVTPSTDAAPPVDDSTESGTPGAVEEVNAGATPVLEEDADDAPVAKPAKKNVNPGAKIAGALKATGDNLRAAVDDLGKKLTKRPTTKTPDKEKAPTADKAPASEKASTSEKSAAGE
jgi:hypothetical protein